jgi:hypothetical protein
MDNYQHLGIVFISFSVPFALYSYFILLNIPLSAFGLSTLVLGVTLLQVPSSPVPNLQIRSMIEASLINVEALLEEYDALGKAIYFHNNERIHAFIPIPEKIKPAKFRLPNNNVRIKTSIDNVDGIIVFPPGSELVRLAKVPEEIGLEDALNLILVDYTEIVEGLKAVEDGNRVVVELTKPKQDTEYDRVRKCLGSLGLSIAGSVIAEVLDKSVSFEREERDSGRVTGYFNIFEADY